MFSTVLFVLSALLTYTVVMKERSGLLIQLDGIAGSGKTTLLRHIRDVLLENESVFNLEAYVKEHNRIPEYGEVDGYDYYFTHEPTKAWVGRAIRDEISFAKDDYSAIEQAQAFSLDRHILFRRIIGPALKSGKIIFQDRGLTTSLLYQTELDEKLTFTDILSLPGNSLIFEEYMPNHLILTHIATDALEERLLSRKETKGMYQDIEMLTRVQKRFFSEEYEQLIEGRGTKIHTIDTSGTYSENSLAIEELIEQLLS